MNNFTKNMAALEGLITAIGENTFIDSLLARLDSVEAEAILTDIATENGLDVTMTGGYISE